MTENVTVFQLLDFFLIFFVDIPTSNKDNTYGGHVRGHIFK
jgi:hypothetical protein